MTGTATTVIIPVGRKHLDLLPRAIASAQAQTVPVAVLVANNSGKRIDGVPGWGVIDVECSDEMTGGQKAAHSRNEALRYVQTPYTLFLDADDTLTAPAVEVLQARYEQGGAGWTYGDWYSVRGGVTEHTPAIDFDDAVLLHRNLHAITALVPTATLQQVEGFDLAIPYFEDWGLWLRLAAAGFRGARVPVATFSYFLDEGENRNKGHHQSREIYDYVQAVYAPQIKERRRMACGSCGGGVAPSSQGFGAMAKRGSGSGEGVTLEFIGGGKGSVTYVHPASQRSYRAGNNTSDKYPVVHPDDVDWLVGTGHFQQVPTPSVPATPFAAKEAPAGVTVTANDGDFAKGNDVGNPGAYVVPEKHSQDDGGTPKLKGRK